MAFSGNRRNAAIMVALVFVLGVAFGVGGMLASRGMFDSRRGPDNRNDPQRVERVEQTTKLIQELGLSTDQEHQFRQILDDTRAKYDAIRDEINPQFKQVRQQNRDRIRQTLSAEQRPLFDKFLQDSRNRRNQSDNNQRNSSNSDRNGAGPSMRRLTSELMLSEAQQTQINGILSDTQTSVENLRQQMNMRFEEVRLQNRVRLRQMLTPEQRSGLEAFFQRRDEERRRK